jgi:DNA-binding LytR/AlgR family response regulator
MILIVEDDILIAEHLLAILEREGSCNCMISNSYSEAMEALEGNNIRLVLLDINLGEGKSGFDFAKVLNKKEIHFIFISAQSDPIAQEKIVESNPSGFILKPFKPVQVTTAVRLLLNQLEKHNLKIDDGKSKYIIDLQKICFIQANRNYTEINYDDQRIVIRKTLTEIESLLPCDQFIRAHRSFIVNRDRIQTISQKELTIGNKVIPISQKYRSNFDNL